MNSLLYLTAIIIVIIIIVLFFYKKDSFVVRADNVNGTDIKNIGETYPFPDCTGCITPGGRLKPRYKYNVSDDRCIKNNTTGYIDSSYLNSIINYTGSFGPGLDTCYTNYNSMYSSIYGKYIILFRNDSIKMKFNHISIHERDTTTSPLSSGAIVFTTNLERNTSGNYIYPETVLNSADTSTITFESGSLVINPSYTVITLPTSVNIGYINIKHSNAIDASTLNGATLAVLDDYSPTSIDISSLPVDLQNFIVAYGTQSYITSTASVVFHTTLNNDDVNRIIYTYNHLYPLPTYMYQNMKIINEWTLPCDNCGSMGGKLFKNHIYRSSTDPRCYKPLTSTINKTILDTEISDLNLTNFTSCSSRFDTRYLPPVGKFIQISRSDGRALGIKIAKIRVYSDYYNNAYTIDSAGDLPSFSALVNTYINDTSLFDNALDDDENTLLSTTNDPSSKIFIDIGSVTNKIIAGIGLKIPKSERYNIVGLKVSIIKIDETDAFNVSKMKLTGERVISSNDVDVTSTEYGDAQSYTYLILLSSGINDLLSIHPDIIINNEVTYNSINKYLTTYKNGLVYYQIPYVIYNMSNGRSIMARTLTDSISTLDKINVSDAVTLFNFSSSTDMSTVPDIVNSHILQPITARYVQIKPDVTYSLLNSIGSIVLYDSNIQVIKSVSNPVVVYEIPHIDYNSYIRDKNIRGTTNGYILIDLGTDTPITFIKIVALIETNMINATLNLINNSGSKVFTYTFTNPIINNYVITDMNAINQSGPHFVNKFSYPSCLTNDICNTIATNTYYTLDDGKCFKSNDIVDPITCINCMSQLSLYSRNNIISDIFNNFTSCESERNTMIEPRFYDPRLLRINDPVTYMSAGTGKPFHSARFMMYSYQEGTPSPPAGLVATGVTGSVRVYTMLPNPVKFRMVRFTNYFAGGGGGGVAPTETDAGVQQANLYVTDTDPTTVYGSNVNSSNLLWSGTIPKNTGIFTFGVYFPYTDVNYYPTNSVFGKYIILDIVNNWGNATKVGIEMIEFVVEHININPVMKFPITGRYIRLRRTDDQIIPFKISEISIYDSTNTAYTVINGSPGTWRNLVDQGTASYAEISGESTAYMELDLGSMKDIYKIQIFYTGSFGNTVSQEIWQLSGVACQVLSDTYDILGEYDIYDSVKMNSFRSNIIDTSIWNTTVSDPASIFLKWDAQQPDSIINTNNLSVSKSNQIIKQWNETKTGDPNWSFFGSNLDGCTIKFVVDDNNYPSIMLPTWSSLRTLGNRTIYYDKTIFLVASVTQIREKSIPFYMGTNWNTLFDAPNRGTNIYSGISYGTYTTPVNHLCILNNFYPTSTTTNDTSTIITTNKKIVIGYKMEFIDSTTMRAVIICSLNPTTIKYTPTVTIGSTLFKANYTNANCIYCLGSRPQSSQTLLYNRIRAYGDLSWTMSPGFYYELNVHNQLSDSEMVTECQRLMTKWKVTP